MTPQIFNKSFTFFIGAEFCVSQNGDAIYVSAVYKIEHINDNKLQYSRFAGNEFEEFTTIKK